MTIAADVQSLSPGGIVELFQLDATSLGYSTILYFHSGTNEFKTDVVWNGNTYTAYPIEAEGFELTTKGTLPQPTMKVANITGDITALNKSYNDLVGAKLTRIRTLVKYLDAVNFTAGNPSADPTQAFPEDVYYVNRKSNENRVYVEYELASAMDLWGVQLPRRQFIQNVCNWVYRSPECSYAGGAVADVNDNPTTILANDVCGKRLTSCKLRFGDYAELPYGGFPNASLF